MAVRHYDYLMLDSFGRDPFETGLNKALSLSPFLWNHGVWPVILERIAGHIIPRFYSSLVTHHPLSELQHRRVKRFYKVLNTHLERNGSLFKTFGIVEFFLFLSDCFRHLYGSIGIEQDVYREEKGRHNHICLGLYRTLKADIQRSPHYLEVAALAALRANWIDLWEAPQVDAFLHGFPAEIEHWLDSAEERMELKYRHPYFRFHIFKDMVMGKPRTILYESDNSGEIVFDLLLIEALLDLGHTVFLSAKGEPVLNDVTVSDIEGLLEKEEFYLLRHYRSLGRFEVISNGSRTLGRYLFNVSEGFKTAYEAADFLLLKGQGHFQSMPTGFRPLGLPYLVHFQAIRYKKPVFYVFGLKSDITLWSLRHILRRRNIPLKGGLFFYYFNPSDPTTYPS